MEMLLYFCGIELVPFASCFPSLCTPSRSRSGSFLQSEQCPETARHTVTTLISLSASLYSSIPHSFLFCLGFFASSIPSFSSPRPSICAAVCSTFISLPHVSFSFFPPPHSPSQSILACPRYPQILLVVAARVSKIVFKDTCICVVVLFCVHLMLLMCTCICLLYYRVSVCSGLSGLQV